MVQLLVDSQKKDVASRGLFMYVFASSLRELGVGNAIS
jgi:hypothetical protein